MKGFEPNGQQKICIEMARKTPEANRSVAASRKNRAKTTIFCLKTIFLGQS